MGLVQNGPDRVGEVIKFEKISGEIVEATIVILYFMTKVAVSKMFNHSKIQISDETNYLKVFQHTDVGMITLRLDLENQVLKRKLRHALGISMPSVRQIEATTDALLVGCHRMSCFIFA